MAEELSNLPVESQGGVFEKIRLVNDHGDDCWDARKFGQILDYAEYRNFLPVIEKAKQACFKSAQDVQKHFVQYNAMIEMGNGAQKIVESYMLSRYACYLIIQNADPGKNIVAKGQTYFAVQTRRQEVADQEKEDQLRVRLREELRVHNNRLAGTAKTAGVVTGVDYAIFQNHGYEGLYGGLRAGDIKQRRKLKKSQNLLDHMGSTELAANFFRVTQAEEKLRREGIMGKEKANLAHKQVGEKVRQTIKEIGGTMPENLPVADDVKKIGRKPRKFLPPWKT